jgi:hypothetical protein
MESLYVPLIRALQFDKAHRLARLGFWNSLRVAIIVFRALT